MRIGLFTDTYLPDINGVVSSTVTLKNALEKAGHTVFVITNHAGGTIEYEDRILRLPGIPLKSLYGYKLSSPVSMGAGTYLRNMNLDVIHLQTNFGVGLYGQAMAIGMGIPLVNTYHTMFEDYTHYINPYGFHGIDKVSKEAIKKVSRQICNHVQAVVAPSIKTKEVLEQYGVEAPIYVVPTGLDLSAFARKEDQAERYKEIRRRVSDHPDDIIVVFVGRLAKEKSLEMPIETFAAMKDPRFHLAIVGGGPDEDYYKELVEKLNAQDKVHFLGKAAPEEIGFYYGAFDAFVSASLSETQGMTYLESMASGLMIFGRRDEVLEDLLEEGITGYYFDTPHELEEKLLEFAKLSQEEKEANGKRCISKTSPYTDETFASTMAAVYDQAILDYSQTYVVEKIKIEDDFVQLTISRDSEKEPVKMRIPLEQYFELKISIDTKLDEYLVNHYLQLQPAFEGWNAIKKRLAGRDMTRAQVIHYLKHNQQLEDESVQHMADLLEAKGLIDDETFAFDKAQYWQDLGYSSRQIMQKLAKAGIELELCQQALESLSTEKEEANAKETAKWLVKQVKDKSARLRRQVIVSKLISKGYSAETARLASEAINLEELDDSTALQNAYAKSKRLYSRLEGKEKTEKVKAYLHRQGFAWSEIYEILESDHDED